MENLKGYYHHFKHNPEEGIFHYCYKVIGIVYNTEENTYSVIYKPLYRDTFKETTSIVFDFYSRPLEMFTGEVQGEEKLVKRFIKIEDSNMIEKLENVS